MATRWGNIVQSGAYQQLSDPEKKKTKEEYWKRIKGPELKRKKITSSQINKRKKDFFSQSSIYIPETDIRPLSMVTTGPIQRFERQPVKPVRRFPTLPYRRTSFPETKTPEKIMSTVSRGSMLHPEKQMFPEVKKMVEKKLPKPSPKQMKKIKGNIKKIKEKYPPWVLRRMVEQRKPITEKTAKDIVREYKFLGPYTKIVGGIVTGIVRGGLTLDTLYEKALEDIPGMRYTQPKTKAGKTIQNWTSFGTVMLNPISPYRLLPGARAVKGIGKAKSLVIVDRFLRKKVSKKVLPHAYRIMGNAIKGGINLPLITLADRTIKAVTDPDYKFTHGLIETGKTILPGMVLGAAFGEIGRGVGKVVKAARKKIYFKLAGVSDKEIEPVKWAQKTLRTKNLKQAQQKLQTSINEYEGLTRPKLKPLKGEKIPKEIGFEERVDRLREEAEAFHIFNRATKRSMSYPRMPKLPVTPKQVQESYKKLRHTYIGSKDINIHDSKVEAINLQNALKNTLKQKKYNTKVKMVDTAMKLYTDLKGAPGDISKYYNKLNKLQQRLVQLSQNLPKEVKEIVNYLETSGRKTGFQAKSAEVIKNVRDNWINRMWDPKSFGKEKVRFKVGRKFGTRSRHILPRRLNSILEGWAKGGQLKVSGAINSLQIYKEEMARTIADKRFLKTLQNMKTADGRPFLSQIKYDDYREIHHPNFKPYKQHRWTAEIKEQLKQGKEFGRGNAFVKGGKLFMPQNIYAPKWVAKDLNNMMDVSMLQKIPGIPTITKYNAILKAWTLQSSFFHNWAFLRSYLLGGNIKKLKDFNPKQAILKGKEFVESSEPGIREGIKQGLTLGIKQDWAEELLHEKTIIGKLLDKWKVSRVVKDKILDLREQHANWLFGKFGMGLKAKAYMIEVAGLQRKYPNADPKALMRMAANLVNDDFGGLHLQRIGKGGLARNPTLQHIFRLFLLAPDWTESNVRSMVKAIAGGGQAQRNMYRNFWSRILTKGAILNLTGNFLLNGQDTLDVYKRMYEEKKFPSIDITNIYRALGGKGDTRKYFSVFGHFLDPIKFARDPAESFHYKSSKLGTIFAEALFGVDWAGRKFTTLSEILGYDKEKGYYKRPTKEIKEKIIPIETEEGLKYPKYGKLKGKTVKWSFRRHPLKYGQIPSFVLNQSFRSQPVIAQKLFEWLLGESEGFDTILNMAGLQVKTTFGGKEAAKKKGVTLIGEEKEPVPIKEPEKIKPIKEAPVPVKKKYPKYIKKGRKPLPYAAYTNAFSIPTARKINSMSEEERTKYFQKKLKSSVTRHRDAAERYLKKIEEE